MGRDEKRGKITIALLCTAAAASIVSAMLFAAALTVELYTIGQGKAFYASPSVTYLPRCAGENTAVQAAAAEFKPHADFDGLREDYPDIVAWIQSEGTNINYPVVHGNDNYFYLNHLADMSSNKMGAIFLDYRNTEDFSDKNIFIYGHNMKSGDKFGSLKQYTCQNYFERHNSMYIFTPERNFKIALFAGFVMDSSAEALPTGFANEDDFGAFISDVKNRSVFTSETDVSFGDRLVFLYTCTDGYPRDERFIIVGKLICMGSSAN